MEKFHPHQYQVMNPDTHHQNLLAGHMLDFHGCVMSPQLICEDRKANRRIEEKYHMNWYHGLFPATRLKLYKLKRYIPRL